MLSLFSRVQFSATSWTVAQEVPLSMGFSRQEYRSRLPRPPPGDLSDPGIKPASLRSPPLAGRFFTTSTTWEDLLSPLTLYQNQHSIGKSWRSQLAREHTSKIFHVLYFHVTARTTFFIRELWGSHQGCQVPFCTSGWNVGLLLIRCSGQGPHLAMTGKPRGFSPAVAPVSDFS